MPVFKYRCNDCGYIFDTIQKAGLVRQIVECKKQCGGKWGASRAVGGPSVYVTETIDSGMMAREVIRPANIEQIMADRDLQDDIDRSPGDWDDSDFLPIE